MDIKKLDSEWKLDVQRHRARAANDRPKGGDVNDSAGLPKSGSLHSNSPGVTAGAIATLSLAGEDAEGLCKRLEQTAWGMDYSDGGKNARAALMREAAALISSLSLRVEAEKRERERLKYRIDLRMNDYLVEMREGYDDSITGFNEAWDIVRSVFADMESNNAGK